MTDRTADSRVEPSTTALVDALRRQHDEIAARFAPILSLPSGLYRVIDDALAPLIKAAEIMHASLPKLPSLPAGFGECGPPLLLQAH